MMYSPLFLRLLFLVLVSFPISCLFSQENLNVNGKEYRVYPHKINANTSWILYNGINRKNRQNIEYLYMSEVGSLNLIEESELENNMNYFESELFDGNFIKLKSKAVHEIRKNALKLFSTSINLHQNITPSLDPLADGEYVQLYNNSFELSEQGDILPKEKHIAGYFKLKNNLLTGFAYWLSTAGDTIESGYYSEGKRTGCWTFNQKNYFVLDEVTTKLKYDQIQCSYKDGLLDGPYIEYYEDSVRFKGFYTAGVESGEWFQYNKTEYTPKGGSIPVMKYYLEKHFTYAEKNPPISRQFLLRNTINLELTSMDSIVLPADIYSSQIDFNFLYDYFEPEVEDLELPEEKMYSYDGGDNSEGDMGMYSEYSTDNKIWYKGKEISKAKLIDSLGIRFKFKDIYEEFYPNGQVKFRYQFKEGKLIHEDSVFWDNGKACNVVFIDPLKKSYSNAIYDYTGKLIYVDKYDSSGEYLTTDKKLDVFSKVQIDNLAANHHKEFDYYEYNCFDTLLKSNLTQPTFLFKSWYFNKTSCAQSEFNPLAKDLTITIRNLQGGVRQNRKFTFGDDYSYYAELKENHLRNLVALTKANASYSESFHKDSLPQSKVYYLKDYQATEDYTLRFSNSNETFSGSFEIEADYKKPLISIKKTKIKLGIPGKKFEAKFQLDYINHTKNKKTKFTKYHDVLDISLSFYEIFTETFPFIDDIIRGVTYNPYDLDDVAENEQQSFINRVKGELKDGKPVGKWLVYDNSGKILRETFYENGEKQGVEKTYAIKFPKKESKQTDELAYTPSIEMLSTLPSKATYYLQHVTHYNKNILNGEDVYYNWDGSIAYKTTYKDGAQHGKSLERNNYVTTISNYSDGLLDGIVKTQLTLPQKDSITLFDLNFQNQQLQGESKSYHANGKLAKRGFFLNNEPIEDYMAYDTLGNNYHYVKFQYSFPVEEKIWEENELSVRYQYDWKDSIYFKASDLVEIPSTYDLLMQYGLADENTYESPYFGRASIIDKTGIRYRVTKYFPNQQIAREGDVDKGKKVGCWSYFDYKGIKLYEVDYFDTILKINDSIKFKAKGIRTDFDSNGGQNIISYVIEKVENYDCSHTDHYEVRQFMTIWEKQDSLGRFNKYVKNYYDDGTLQSEGKMNEGLPTGVWKFYTPNGQLNQVGEYVKGKRNGRWLKGDLSKTNYLGDICLNPNLPDLEKRLAYQENVLDITIRYFKLGKIVSSEYYDINLNEQKNKK